MSTLTRGYTYQAAATNARTTVTDTNAPNLGPIPESQPPIDPATGKIDRVWKRWLDALKLRVEAVKSIDAGTIISGVLATAQIPQLPSTRLDLTAAPRLLGRTTAGAGASEEIRVGATLRLADGILSIAGLPSGYTIGDLLYADTDHSLARLADVSAGSYLRSGGVATAPLWSTLKLPNAANSGDILKASSANTIAAAAPAALTKADDTNVTLTLGGSAASALVNAASITLGWAGLLGLARGGTNADLSATGGANQVLKQSSAGAAITVGTLAASNLSDYAEGTWTPAISFGAATTGITYDASTSGVYVKVGRLVFISGKVLLTSKGSATGVARLTGLPFTVANSEAARGGCPLAEYENFSGLVDGITAHFTLNATEAVIYTGGATIVVALQDTNFTNTTKFYFGACYQSN
jgi:hypothetical protein